MKKLKYSSIILRINALVLLTIIMCSCQKSSIFDEVHTNYDEAKPWLYIFAPHLYCKGCMSRTLNIVRNKLEYNDYQFILLKEQNDFKKPEENYSVIDISNYEKSKEYDYLMYSYLIHKDGTYTKLQLDTEEAFAKLDSLVMVELATKKN